MTDKGVPKKVDKFVRKPPKQRRNTDIMPFKAPRKVSTDVEPKQTIETTPPESDTTSSTPEMFRSPDVIQDKVPGFIMENHPDLEPTVVQKTVAPRKYKGWVYIDETIHETELQDKSSDSEDNIPVARLLKAKEGASLSTEQMEDWKEGPKGLRAVGKTVAKMFDAVEFRGTVDSFRIVRQRYYYHIIYSDGDEEDMSQLELRDAYLLTNKDAIEAKWDQLQGKDKGKEAVATEDTSEGETSDGEGSEYDRHDYDEEMKQTKRKRKFYKRANKKCVNELAGVILPQTGDKTVAGEAFSKLDDAQKQLVTEKVNKKTKQVKPLCCTRSFSATPLYFFF